MALAEIGVETGAVVQRTRSAAAQGERARRALRALDLVIVAAAMGLSFAASGAVTEGTAPGYTEHVAVAMASLPLWAAALSAQRLYTSRYVAHRLDEVRRLSVAVVAGSTGVVALGFFSGWAISRGWVLTTFASAFVGLLAGREGIRRLFAWRRRTGRSARPVVLVGSNADAMALHASLQAPHTGYQVVGSLAPEGVAASVLADRIIREIDRSGAGGVVISSTESDLETSSYLARTLTDRGVHVEMSMPLVDIAPERLSVRIVDRMPVIAIDPVARQGWRPVAKRVFDVAVAGFVLLVSAPVLAVAAAAIALDTPGGILFRQERVGRDGSRFRVLKLRTMVADAETLIIDLRHRNEADGPLFKILDDPRVTRVGRFLRATSVDELPQLWNVIRGEMSLVGPRPALPSELDGWHERLFERLRVAPGITGMWQVNGRSSASFDDYSRYDLYYVDNWSLPTDLCILARTLPAVLLRRGAC